MLKRKLIQVTDYNGSWKFEMDVTPLELMEICASAIAMVSNKNGILAKNMTAMITDAVEKKVKGALNDQQQDPDEGDNQSDR